jgi:hypothetical protein
VEPIIDLAPGAEESALAVEIVERVRRNLAESPRKIADFKALRGTILIVADDQGDSLSLRFDHGRLTVHEGSVGVPSVTFCGAAEALRRLFNIRLGRVLRLPIVSPLSRAGREAIGYLAGLLARGDLKVYGVVSHPRTTVLLLRILSAHG